MKIASKPWFVPDTTTLQDQLNAFLRRKAHFAIVVDEYGEVEGLVTLEDIIEEIVGEIADEHDVDIQGVKQEADGSVVVDGTVPIRDLNRALDWNLPDEEATTIAGLVIHEAQSIPEEKQAFTFHGKRFVVHEARQEPHHADQDQACRLIGALMVSGVRCSIAFRQRPRRPYQAMRLQRKHRPRRRLRHPPWSWWNCAACTGCRPPSGSVAS